MSTTSAEDLLRRAEYLTRALRDARPAVTLAQWETFDVTFHRLLHELVGTDAQRVPHNDPQSAALKATARAYPSPLRPPADEYLSPAQTARLTGNDLHRVYREIHLGHLHSIQQGRQLYVRTPQLDTRPDIKPADPVDPHPLARLSVTLGVLADLIHEAQQHDTPLLPDHGDLARVVTHVVALGMVAASTTIDTIPHRDADRPLHVAQYTEHVLDMLGRPEQRHRPMDLPYAIADTPTPAATPAGRLHDALHAWHAALRNDITASIPNAETLRTLAYQAAHLSAVTLTLRRAAHPELTTDTIDDALRAVVTALPTAGAQWKHLTTLNLPSHAFTAASSHLAEVLKQTAAEAPRMDPVDLTETLYAAERGLESASTILDQTRTLPDRLVRSGLVFAPARRLPHNLDHLAAQARGGYVPAQLCDVPELDPTWRQATNSLNWAVISWRQLARPTIDHTDAFDIDLGPVRTI